MARNDDAAARRRAKRREELGDEAVPETTPAETPNSAPEGESTVDAATDLEREAVEASGAVAGGEVTTTGGPRIFNFFRASWAELQRVRWPNGAQVAQGTAVTLGFVVIAGAFLGLADVAARQIVNLII